VSTDLLELDVREDADVVLLAAAARVVGEAVGLPEDQQERLAATLSERGETLRRAGGGRVVLLLDGDRLRVDGAGGPLTCDGPARVTSGASADRTGLALAVARAAARDATRERARGAQLQALYDELSGELETTNQGVVALYAELDDRSRQLREASEAKTRFLNNISHELRTPGNSVLGLARLLLDPAADPLTGEQRQQVELVRSSAEDLLRLVNELLDLAKAESGRLEPHVDDVDLAALFEVLRGTIEPLVTRPGVTLQVQVPGDLGPVRTDRTLLGHLLRNLLSNAVKFTEEGTVSMTAARRGPVLQVVVSDTGIGIAEEDQPRVFEEFFQVHNMLQRSSPGSGLGLPLARRIATVLGGGLELTSARGRGSTFTLTLPVDGPRALPGSGPS
jgi:signal transduction histidine kinase